MAADQKAAADVTATTSGTPDVPFQLTPEKMMQDNLLILGLLFFIFYFILIRPQQKRLKAHQTMLKGLQKGSKVMTSGGIIGTIVRFEGNDIVILEIAQGIKIRVARTAVSDVVTDTGASESANDN